MTDMTSTQQDIAAINSRRAEIKAAIDAIDAEQAALGETKRALITESRQLAEQVVASWGPDATAEQLLFFCGTDGARAIITDRVESMSRGCSIRNYGTTADLKDGKYISTGLGFDSYLYDETVLDDLGAAMVDIAEHFRTGRDWVPFQLSHRSRTKTLRPGLENGKVAHHILIDRDGVAQAVETFRSSEDEILFTGSPVDAIRAAIAKAYED